MAELITPELIDLDFQASSKQEAIRKLVDMVAKSGRSNDPDQLYADVLIREGQMQTGLEGGIGIPHARSNAVSTPSLAFARLPSGVDFGAADGPADLVFLIAVPSGSDSDHMKIIASLARKLVHESFKSGLRSVSNAFEAAELINQEVSK